LKPPVGLATRSPVTFITGQYGGAIRETVRRARLALRGGAEPPAPGWLEIPPAPEAKKLFAKPPFLLRAYEQLLAPLRNEPFTLLELGVDRADSLVMWRDGFPRATIVGVDLELPDVDLGPRVHLARGDQSDRGLLTSLRERFAPDGFRVVVDDASHLGAVTARSLQALFVDHLQPDGLYVIEDWETGYMPAESWPDGAKYHGQVDVAALDRADEGRMPSHDHGMVGLVKRVVDHTASDRICIYTPDSVGETLPVESMVVRQGMVVLRKSPDVE
jgi:hypothetical protein